MTVIEVETATSAPESQQSAVSWAAIFAGAAAAIAVTLVMLLLGSGLGFAAVSPWGNGASAATVAISTVIWLIITQWVASGFGGYITGRLRTKWVGVHTDEVFFRDTAHGFIAWCVATIIVVGLLSSAVGSVVSQGVQSTTALVSGAAQGAAQGATSSSSGASVADPSGYFIDLMFRPSGQQPAPAAQGDGTAVRGEVARILVQDAAAGEFPAADKAYLAQLVASRTGLPQADAEKRVNDVLAQIQSVKDKAKEAADTARKAALTTSLLTVVAMLVGAFIAAVAAAYAGSRRDEDPVVIRR